MRSNYEEEGRNVFNQAVSETQAIFFESIIVSGVYSSLALFTYPVTIR